MARPHFKKTIITLGVILLTSGLLITVVFWFISHQYGFYLSDWRIDWQAVIDLHPPIFVSAPMRIIHISFSDRTLFDKTLNSCNARLDIWSISDNVLIGRATDGSIRRLERAGLQVVIDYSSYEDYLNEIESIPNP